MSGSTVLTCSFVRGTGIYLVAAHLGAAGMGADYTITAGMRAESLTRAGMGTDYLEAT
jgi:hypothetical protein